MNRVITIALAMFVGAGLGAAAVQGLHAQAKPPAFNIAEITVTNDEGYNKEYVPPIVKSIAAQAIGDKYATFRGYQIEGVSP